MINWNTEVRSTSTEPSKSNTAESNIPHVRLVGANSTRLGPTRVNTTSAPLHPHGSPVLDVATDAQMCMDVRILKQTILACLDNALDEVERCVNLNLASQHNHVQQLASRANAMAGKRLRPILVLLSAQAAQPVGRLTFEQARRNLVQIATAAELVHMASLVHDDVMDQAKTRRHQPTIYSSAGENGALLLGDYLFTRGYATASNCGSTFPARTLASAATQLCEGELRQQASARNWDLSVKEYLSIIGQKTASLCVVCCRLGAWQVGASVVTQRSLHRFGNLLGLAFQVFDDWLDYWGNDQTGKTLGTDLAQLKPTLPLIKFLQSCSSASRHQLLNWATSNDLDQLAVAYEMIRQSDAGEKTLSTAQNLVQRAIAALNTLPESSARSALQAVAYFSISRST